MLSEQGLKTFLDAKVEAFNLPKFIPLDPVAIPHEYTKNKTLKLQVSLLPFLLGVSERPLSTRVGSSLP